MRYRVFAADYDGTLAYHGIVEEKTWESLERIRAAGTQLVLVTGRLRQEIEAVCNRMDMFDMVVAENGAIVFEPGSGTEKQLAPSAPPALIEAMRERGVAPLTVGRAVIATLTANEGVVGTVVANSRLDLSLIKNQESLMILPRGVHKGSGLDYALAEMNRTWSETVGVGDAENDVDFLIRCGLSVAVANALPVVKDQAGHILSAACGEGVVELVSKLLDGWMV